jgi:hypothetical protein
LYPTANTVVVRLEPTTAWGRVHLEANGVSIADGFISHGSRTFDVSLPLGTYDLKAFFHGSEAFAPSETRAVAVASRVWTATSLRTSPSIPKVGEMLTVHARTEVVGSYNPDGGTLRIVDASSGETLAAATGTGAALEVRAQMRVSEVGRREFQAIYDGTDVLADSSATSSIVLGARETAVRLTAPSLVHPGPFTFVAQVEPVPESGEVTFTRMNVDVATVDVDRHGRASVTLDLLPNSGGNLEARFSGSPLFKSSYTSVLASIVVDTDLSLAAGSGPWLAGADITLVGSVSAVEWPGPNYGLLEIRDGAAGPVLGRVNVTDSNRAISVTTQLSEGTHEIVLAYNGQWTAYQNSSTSLTIDVAPPERDSVAPSGTVAVNGGAEHTRSADVTLDLSASDAAPGTGIDAVGVRVPRGTWTWLDYNRQIPWTLTGADGKKTLEVRFRDGAGNTSASVEASIVLDRAAPTAIAPTPSLIAGSTIGASVPLRVALSVDDALSGVSSVVLGESSDGGASYKSVQVSPTAASITRSVVAGTNYYRHRVRATDEAGNVGAWASGPAFRVRVLQETSRYVARAGEWAFKPSASASGGGFISSARAGARVTVSFTGRQIAFVTKVGPSMGKADVILDGQVTTIDFFAPTNAWRRVVFVADVAPGTAHTLEIRVTGAKSPQSASTRVVADAFVVIQ